MGLVREADVMERALGLLPQPYPVDRAARAHLFGYETGPERNEFDRMLLHHSRDFGDVGRLEEAVDANIRADPGQRRAILALYWSAPKNVRDSLRYGELAIATDPFGVDTQGPGDEVARRMAILPPEARRLLALTRFAYELENGGLHQFFYNYDGSLAPEVPDALEAIGRTEQAKVVRTALGYFPHPFPRDTDLRRANHFHDHEWNRWDEELSALTERFYQTGGHLSPAVLAFGVREGFLRPE